MAYRKKSGKKASRGRSAKRGGKTKRKGASRTKRSSSRRSGSVQRIQIVMPAEKPTAYPSLVSKKKVF